MLFEKVIAILHLICYISNYQKEEDKNMNTFYVNSLRRRERRRNRL